MGFPHQHHGELHGTNLPIGFGDSGPGEHSGFGWFHRPANAVQTVAKYVSATLVELGLLTNAVLWAVQSGDGWDLNGSEDSIVVIDLDPVQSCNYFWVSKHRIQLANPPCCRI